VSHLAGVEGVNELDDTDRPASIRVVRVSVPVRRPHRSAHGTEDRRESILVRWRSADGADGWGECPALAGGGYVVETPDQAWSALTGRLLDGLRSHGHRAGMLTPVDPTVPAASAALADAALDSRLRAEGVRLADHLARQTDALVRPAVATTAVLADVGRDVEAVVDRAVVAIEAGASMVKVKIAPGHDIAVLTGVRDRVERVPVAADANGSLVDDALLAAVDAVGLAYLEQPRPPGRSWNDLAADRGTLATPIALDESLRSVLDVGRAVRAGALDVASVKPARLGGAVAAAHAARLCAGSGLDAFVGGMFELGIGRATASAVASLSYCSLPTDLGPSDRYFDIDVCEPIVANGSGDLVVPDGPGCGRIPDEDVLARFALADVELAVPGVSRTATKRRGGPRG